MRKRAEQQTTESPDMTPMLDVVFIMLIFFIVTTTFVKESAVDWSGIDKNTPQTSITKDSPLIVTIDETDSILVQGRMVEIAALRSNIEAERAKSNYSDVVVRAHSIASAGLLVNAVDQIKLAGISQVVVAKL